MKRWLLLITCGFAVGCGSNNESATTPDGTSPQTAITPIQTYTARVPFKQAKRRNLDRVVLVWESDLGAGKRCYLEITEAEWPNRYAWVPEDWCEGMR